MRRIVYSKQAVKTLGRMPSNISKLIRHKIAVLGDNPEALSNTIKALKGTKDVYRLRVGDWRVIFKDTGDVVEVEKIATRGDVYD